MQDWLFNPTRRNPNRIEEITNILKEIWLDAPDLRLRQLICILSKDRDVFSVEDDVLMAEMKEFRRKNAENIN
ncbi:DUF1040 family protein [Ligilactobacillus ruminis]|uniref:Acid anhydride hydrolase n=1 Tax=Ligilactobacillus ruminis DPC 6832 TaxID=1402208 RepID=A0A837DXG5_9LACO|nr:DUF1040 family protein [Ligilactobacillus ruminis]KIC05449.1 acid anhydride hydrolase [Ligilactobacillus ruminis DPC 6832]WKB70986.1 DUF1040 family protein [Ligilactobacillus ruminis]